MAPMTSLVPRIYLASQSLRRRELLTQIGVRFDLLPFRSGHRSDPATCEDPFPGEAPEAYVQRIAATKAHHGARLLHMRHLPQRLLLAADTTLDLEGEIIGKPADETDAIAILGRLSGRSHRVLTAITLMLGERAETRVSISEVAFRPLDPDEIRRYVATGESHDKAGAYALQGRAAAFVEAIRGSPSGIVGLPLCETVLLLREFGHPA